MWKYFILATLVATAALAQQTEIIPGTVSDGAVAVTAVEPANIWQQVQEVALTIFYAILPPLGIIVVFFVRQYMGERAAQIAQAIIQGAAERGAGKAIEAAPSGAVKINPAPGVEYMNKTMAEKIAKMGITPNVLTDLVLANIGKLMAGKPAAVKEETFVRDKPHRGV